MFEIAGASVGNTHCSVAELRHRETIIWENLFICILMAELRIHCNGKLLRDCQLIILNSGLLSKGKKWPVTSILSTRCERWRWTYMSLPLSPSLASSAISTDMGVTGLAVTGGTFYNHLSSPGHRHPDHHHGGAAAAPQSPPGARSGPPPSASVCHLYIFSEETLGGGERKYFIIAKNKSSNIKQTFVRYFDPSSILMVICLGAKKILNHQFLIFAFHFCHL